MKIAFVGKICSGKTTASQYMMSYFSNMKNLSFADKLKDIAYELFAMKEKDRALLQKIGTAMRSIDPDVFANYLIKQSHNYKYVCVDDGRYKNEISALKRNGFKLIKLNISAKLQLERLKNTYPHTYKEHSERFKHQSEQEMDTIDNSVFDLIINVDKEDVYKRLKQYFLF